MRSEGGAAEPVLAKGEREMLKAIYRRTRGRDGATEAHTGALAEALEVSPSTVTATVERLNDSGLATHKPSKGVELTACGRGAAVAAIRRHRIAERFLSDMLGFPWNEADRLATKFEHELPSEVEERLFVALDRPSTCPHGFPVPQPEMVDIPDLRPLYALEPGDVAVMAVPGSMDHELATFLDSLGLRPGVPAEVREKHPFNGPLVSRVDGGDRTLGSTVARQVFVSKEGQLT